MSIPLFNDFGKNSGDVLSKKYSPGLSVKTVHTTSTGVKFESSGKTASGGHEGTIKGSYKDTWGSVEGSLCTTGSASGKVKFTQLMDNLTVTASGNQKPRADPAAKVEALFAQDFFSAKGTVEATQSGAKLEGMASIGTDGLSVGVIAQGAMKFGELKKDEPAFSIKEVNLGVDYKQKEYGASLKTASNAEDVNLSYWQKISPAHQLGASFNYKSDISNPTRALTVGSEYRIDADTLIKIKAGTNAKVGAALQYTVKDPSLLLGVSAEFDATNYSFRGDKFGLNLSFGEF